nr:MAG TPA: hypothetical protein [Caudoviricetes sp.]
MRLVVILFYCFNSFFRRLITNTKPNNRFNTNNSLFKTLKTQNHDSLSNC